jgi:hypothetical protein
MVIVTFRNLQNYTLLIPVIRETLEPNQIVTRKVSQPDLDDSDLADQINRGLISITVVNDPDSPTLMSGASDAELAILASTVTTHTSNHNNPHVVTAAQAGAATTGALSSHTSDTGNPHSVTAAQVGSPTTGDFTGHTSDTGNPHSVTAAQVDAPTTGDFTGHTSDTGNPHSVTAAQVGSPTTGDFTGHTSDTGNPHSVTAAQVDAPTTGDYSAHDHNSSYKEEDFDVASSDTFTISEAAAKTVLNSLMVFRDGLLMRRDPSNPPAVGQYNFAPTTGVVTLQASDTAWFHVQWVKSDNGVG